ncbi:4Fe-4S dicluster domain-containing protein [Shewanella dokdonensis]|uniref:4Fe-4S dicluster domain-containing protein n=1 Tax=Shewanella dokdonensis TaxID=712036 RepID=A0ABX8DH71_9GAMM|nr:4Fe-4S dicluster domain-containing protein [Shewanella dokdonensis]MCL1074439.1 4Fe-4S dicluster domain-containing protein [Shewanella dokdonensis]QVK24109.1 4Fe-4S dicluster domain-containing protein [Shewanella dokdonensis]
MKYAITDKCVGCHACQLVCPNQAVYADPDSSGRFHIHRRRCSGCEGQYAAPQCASICPIEEAIVNELNIAVNPRGSLTGIGASL